MRLATRKQPATRQPIWKAKPCARITLQYASPPWRGSKVRTKNRCHYVSYRFVLSSPLRSSIRKRANWVSPASVHRCGNVLTPCPDILRFGGRQSDVNQLQAVCYSYWCAAIVATVRLPLVTFVLVWQLVSQHYVLIGADLLSVK